ncbi:MAG: T9SS type A sorting domain-containing protein [Vicingaceae bacterium]
MKKNYALLSALVIAGSMSFAQNLQQKFIGQQATPELTVGETPEKGGQVNSKAPGDTLYYEDFGTGGPAGSNLPAGWTTTNNAGNANDWIWSTAAPGGQYSGATGPLNSTTGANGFLSLPGDLYNTPAPPGGFVGMDASVQSPAITINPPVASVLLRIEQAHRFCCVATGDLTIEVSNDGINWDQYDAAPGIGPNTATANAQVFTVNVSATLAFQSTAYVRFYQSGSSHYYWMIDDVTLIEGNANNMQLEDFGVNYVDTFDFSPVYTMVPQCLMLPMSFDGATFNAGSNTQTDVYVKAETYQDSSLAGAPGVGLTWADSTLVGASVPTIQRDTENVAGYINTIDGYFTSFVSVVSDSLNQDPASAVSSYRFTVSDTVLARERGENFFVGDAGPGNYVGGGVDGDRWGVLFTVPNVVTINSLSIYVANSNLNDGVQIVPKVWSFEQDSATLTGAMSMTVAENLVPTTIDTSMFDEWIELDFAFGTGPATLQPGQYVMGWEQISGGTNGLEFTAGRDRTMEPFSPDVTNFVYVNDAAPAWGWVSQVAAVRANFSKVGCIVGLDENEMENALAFEVSPNPNNGQFAININTQQEADYTLNVRNMLGQIVMTQQVSVNKTKNMQMDLSDYEKGVYFVSLENGDERLVKKVVVK